LIFLKLKHNWIGGFCFRMGQIVNMLRARLRDDPRDFHAVNAMSVLYPRRAGRLFFGGVLSKTDICFIKSAKMC
jgi:hypothetical protein